MPPIVIVCCLISLGAGLWVGFHFGWSKGYTEASKDAHARLSGTLSGSEHARKRGWNP